LKAALKSFHAAVTGGKKAVDTQRKAQSALDKAVKRGVMSKNKAARKKRQLNAIAKRTVSVSKATLAKKKVAKKTVAKKAAPKKASAKKPAAKKSTAKKK
jgi:histone H1/5